jgi:hypothetical protein
LPELSPAIVPRQNYKDNQTPRADFSLLSWLELQRERINLVFGKAVEVACDASG